MAIQQTDSAVLDWIRQRRKAKDLTQEDVVRELERAGVAVSRGHYASLERGRGGGLKADHVVALDHVLDAGGTLILLAEREWGQPISSSLLRHWARLGQGIHDDWVQLVKSSSDGWPFVLVDKDGDGGDFVEPEFPADRLEMLSEWWKSVSDGEVFESSASIEKALDYLLTLAASEPLPHLRRPIEFSGAFEGFRKEGRRAGLPRRVRNAVRAAMVKGWECRHYIPMHPDDVDSATLVYVASPLIACRQFKALTVDPARVPVVENLLTVPGVATVQFYATNSTRRIDAAVIHKRPEARRVIEERIKQIASASKEFEVKRFERPREAEVTSNEIKFQRLLTNVSKLGGHSYVLAGDLPSSTIPLELYADGLKKRSDKARDVKPTVWKEMKDLHAERVNALEAHLEGGLRHQVIVTRKALLAAGDPKPTPGADHTKVYLSTESRIAHLQHVMRLMDTDNFEVRIGPNELADRIKWEVRDRGSSGALIVHTDYTPPETSLPEGVKARDAQVDLKIEAKAAVKAFTAFFRDVWETKTIITDPQKVKDELRDVCRQLAEQDRETDKR